MNVKKLIKKFLFTIPAVSEYLRFRQTIHNKVTFRQWITWKLRKNKRVYWPVHPNTEVSSPNNIYVGINSNPGTRPGCYIQGVGQVYIGDYVTVSNNVTIISANHDPYDHSKHIRKTTVLHDYCWIGTGASIMAGVELGPRTIVGSGSVVTKSFPEGFCVIGGNPAKLIKTLDKELFVPTHNDVEFYGYVPKEKWAKFKAKYKIKTPHPEGS